MHREQTSGLVGAFGVLSVLSGAAMLVAPRTMARAYGLPRSAALVRVLGARDVVIGALLLGGATRPGLLGRSASDALDVALMLREASRRRATVGVARRAIVGAASSVLAAAAANG